MTIAVLCLCLSSLAVAGSLTGFKKGLLSKLLKAQLTYGEVVIPWDVSGDEAAELKAAQDEASARVKASALEAGDDGKKYKAEFEKFLQDTWGRESWWKVPTIVAIRANGEEVVRGPTGVVVGKKEKFNLVVKDERLPWCIEVRAWRYFESVGGKFGKSTGVNAQKYVGVGACPTP